MPDPALRIPLAIDLAVILTVIFGGGIVYQKVETLAVQVSTLQQTVDAQSPQSTDRLARIEERIIGLQAQMTDLKREVREAQR
jgi:outer membrane murein-binding lipoprotein Lpp